MRITTWFSQLLLLLLLVAACKNNPKNEGQQATSPIAEEVADASFDQFFIRFRTDSSFQVARIQFPVPLWEYTYNPDEAGLGIADSLAVTDSFYVSDYSFIQYEKSTDMPGIDYEIERDTIENEMRVNMIDADNGIATSTIFKNINGRWYMVKVVDESDY